MTYTGSITYKDYSAEYTFEYEKAIPYLPSGDPGTEGYSEIHIDKIMVSDEHGKQIEAPIDDVNAEIYSIILQKCIEEARDRIWG